MRPLVRLASVFLLFATAGFAQVHETIHVNLVEVPVTVIDRNGDPVRGLTQNNFELIDQGHKQPITSFDVIDFGSPEINRASQLNPAARRTFLLLFDLSFSSPLGRSKAQEAALNFVARSMKRRDLAAVATIDVDKGFRLLSAFTTDRTLLTAAIKSPITFSSTDPLQIAGKVTTDIAPQATIQTSSSQTNDRAAVDTDVAQEIQRGQDRLNDQFNRARIQRQVTLLGGLARALRMVPGRKQVVFFSEGFDPRLVRGRDVLATADATEEATQEENGELWKIDADNRYGDTRSLSVVDQMARMFRGSDVVLDAVDIQGVRVQNDIQSGATINSNDGLFLLAKPTGGVVFRNSNDLKNDLERMLRQQEVVYVLGFQAPTDHPGRFHDLKVRVQGMSGVQLSHRAGYYEAGGENALEKLLSNAQIVLNDLPQTDIRVAQLAVPFPTAGNAQVPVILEINGADLLRDAKTNAVTTDIYIYAFDDDGTVRDRMFQRMRLDLPKIGEKLRESGIKFYATLSLPPGKYSVKSLVRVLETEKKGYARTDIAVPADSDVVVLPPFFVEDPGKWVMVKGGSHDPTHAPYPFHINGEPFIPSVGVEVHNGQPREFAVFVYNAAPNEMAWQTSVSDVHGSARTATPRLVKEMKGEDVTKLMFQYAPADLGAGDAQLNFTVQKKGSADVRTASVALKVH